jgi:hypothetical protein
MSVAPPQLCVNCGHELVVADILEVLAGLDHRTGRPKRNAPPVRWTHIEPAANQLCAQPEPSVQ